MQRVDDLFMDMSEAAEYLRKHEENDDTLAKYCQSILKHKNPLIPTFPFLKIVIYMAEHKHKRESENLVEIDSEELGFVLEPTQIEVGAGYTVSVSYDENEKQIVDVKTYGEVNIAKLRREIERIFPNAKIRQLNPKQSVTIVKRRKRKRNIKKK